MLVTNQHAHKLLSFTPVPECVQAGEVWADSAAQPGSRCRWQGERGAVCKRVCDGQRPGGFSHLCVHQEGLHGQFPVQMPP